MKSTCCWGLLVHFLEKHVLSEDPYSTACVNYISISNLLLSIQLIFLTNSVGKWRKKQFYNTHNHLRKHGGWTAIFWTAPSFVPVQNIASWLTKLIVTLRVIGMGWKRSQIYSRNLSYFQWCHFEVVACLRSRKRALDMTAVSDFWQLSKESCCVKLDVMTVFCFYSYMWCNLLHYQRIYCTLSRLSSLESNLLIDWYCLGSNPTMNYTRAGLFKRFGHNK